MIFQLLSVRRGMVFQGPLWYLRNCLNPNTPRPEFSEVVRKLQEPSWEDREDVWTLMILSDAMPTRELYHFDPEETRKFLLAVGVTISEVWNLEDSTVHSSYYVPLIS